MLVGLIYFVHSVYIEELLMEPNIMILKILKQQNI